MRVVCQMSGGADSTLAAIKARERWPEEVFYGAFVDYQQICVAQEMKCAKRLAHRLGLASLRIIKFRDIWSGGGMISGEQENDLDVYTPLRNVAILGATMAYAESIEADIIITGSKGFSKIPGEPHSYYDSTISFYKLMEAVWFYATERERVVKIIPILAEGRNSKMSKKKVYDELLQHKIRPEDTWSCFKGGTKECGKCFNCLAKAQCTIEEDED